MKLKNLEHNTKGDFSNTEFFFYCLFSALYLRTYDLSRAVYCETKNECENT